MVVPLPEGKSGAGEQQRSPVATQDLDAAEGPPITLLAEALVGQGHDPLAEWSRQVDGPVAVGENPQACLSVFGDDPLVPAADLLEDRATDETHRAGEDDRVPTGPADHANVEEIGEAHVAGAVE